MGLFDAINKSPSPKTATELAEITGGDKLLIGSAQICSHHARFECLILFSPCPEAVDCYPYGHRDGI